MAGVVGVVLQLGCQHGGLAHAVRGGEWVWLGGSCAHLAREVVLARLLLGDSGVSIKASSIAARAAVAREGGGARSMTLSVY